MVRVRHRVATLVLLMACAHCRKKSALVHQATSPTTAVNVFGERVLVPVHRHPKTGSLFTTLFITEEDKMNFLFHAVINLHKHSGVFAPLVLCPGCSDATVALSQRKGLLMYTLAPLRDMSAYAFREDGPMPQSAVKHEDGNIHMRRHSPYMFVREWVKYILLENRIGVAIVDLDLCYIRPSPLLLSEADIVVEAQWPHSNMLGRYSFPFVRQGDRSIDILLNNGPTYFESNNRTRAFARQFMGLLASEIYLDYGFAQTAFMKLMNETRLRLGVDARNPIVVTGRNADGLTVDAFRMNFDVSASAGHHITGDDWFAKVAALKELRCWSLCADYAAQWASAQSWSDFVQRCSL